jgi:hypothetical protein
MNMTDVYDRLTIIANRCLDSDTQTAFEDVYAKLIILQSDLIRFAGVKR